MSNGGPDVSEVDHARDTPDIDDKAWAALGKVLVDMITKGGYRPKDEKGRIINAGDVGALQEFLNAEASKHLGEPIDQPIIFPERIKTFRIEQASWTEFVLRFPAWQVAEVGRRRVSDGGDTGPDGTYEEPPFYSNKLLDADPMKNDMFFFARVADYTMSMCK